MKLAFAQRRATFLQINEKSSYWLCSPFFLGRPKLQVKVENDLCRFDGSFSGQIED